MRVWIYVKTFKSQVIAWPLNNFFNTHRAEGKLAGLSPRYSYFA